MTSTDHPPPRPADRRGRRRPRRHAPASPGPAGPVVKLRILETTDLHVNILPYDYYRDAADDTVGLARTATLVKAARAEAKNSLLFDNGDLIQGSPLGDFVAYRQGHEEGRRAPDGRRHERARLRLRHARQPRVQLRPRLPAERARHGEIPARLRQRHQGQRRDAAEALARARPRGHGREPARSRRSRSA